MWLSVQDGKLHLRGLVDGEGYVLLNVRCPVACGKCCEDWHCVVELMGLESREGRCPNLRASGCMLKREKRPMECRAYACQLCQLVLLGQANSEDSARVVAAGFQKEAAKYLGLELRVGEAWRPRFREKDKRLVRRLVVKKRKAMDRLLVSMVGKARGAMVVEERLEAHHLGWRDDWPYF